MESHGKQQLAKKLESIESFIPQIFSALLLLGGGILLVSGATRAKRIVSHGSIISRPCH
jgi:hypothetical protein